MKDTPMPAMTIESGIAIPPAKRRGRPAGYSKYPLLRLNPGQSFHVEIPRVARLAKRTMANVNNAIGRARKADPTRKFTQRQMTEKGKRIFRVWRTDGMQATQNAGAS